MENKRQFTPDLENNTMNAFIEKIHSCADCPIRKLAIKQPRSIFARLHMWHKTWWPGWKAHEARTCAYAARLKAQA